MADKSTSPPEIKILQPKNLNLRVGRNGLPSGYVDRCQGLWPKQSGIQQRLPGKTLFRLVEGEVRQLKQTFTQGSPILAQIGNTLQYFTLDELRNRVTTSDLVASVGNEEDQVGIAVMVQIESNTQSGGSADGFLSGVSAATANTFYGARLTDILTNETVNALLTVNTFTASTGGAGVVSTPGTFTLVPGTYRIDCWALYAGDSGGNPSVAMGLWNDTDSVFEVYSGTAEPILASPQQSNQENRTVRLMGAFTVSGGNKVFQINQACTAAGNHAQSLNFSGRTTNIVAANVNGAAARNVYKFIKLYRMT